MQVSRFDVFALISSNLSQGKNWLAIMNLKNPWLIKVTFKLLFYIKAPEETRKVRGRGKNLVQKSLVDMEK